MPPKHNLYKALAFLAVIFFLVTIIPFLVLGFYNVPVADDFVFAHNTTQQGFLQSQIAWYRNWTGRYVATLFISANPLYFKSAVANALVPAFFILSFCGALYYFFKSFAGLKRAVVFALFALFFAVYVSNLHTVSQAFYWMPSLHTYVTGLIFFLCFWGYFFRLCNGMRLFTKLTYPLSAVLLFLMAGTSEVLIFYQNYLLLGVLVYCYFRYKPMAAFALFSFVLSLAFGLFSLLAPGNFARRRFNSGKSIDYFHQTTVMLDTVGRRLLPQYVFNLSGLLLLLFIASLLLGKKNDLRPLPWLRLRPLLLFAFLFFGFLVTFLPQLIANTSEERAFNFSYFIFLLSAVVIVVYTGWYYSGYNFLHGKAVRPLAVVLLFVSCALATFLPQKNTAQAYADLFSGRAACYNAEETARSQFLEQRRGQRTAYLTPLTCKPPSLFVTDASTDPFSWKNDGYRLYFGIDTVCLAPLR